MSPNRDEQKTQNNLYRQLFAEAPVAYHSVDYHGRLLDVNQARLKLLGG